MHNDCRSSWQLSFVYISTIELKSSEALLLFLPRSPKSDVPDKLFTGVAIASRVLLFLPEARL
jgi:hypothetical protein